MQTYTYRDKLFMYSAELVRDVKNMYDIDIFNIVRNGIDNLIAQGAVFQRVSVTLTKTDSGEIQTEVKPV